ncbi:MAG: IS1634 family transposase [Trueperaceae bacterium]|nr:MAG: IS1634 family transposase [Trueperaceae bacterium]
MSRTRGVHVVTTTRSYKGKSYHAHLLRRSYREGNKVKKETVANLTSLGDEVVELIRSALRGEPLAPAEKVFEVLNSKHHGHVKAVLLAMKQLGFEKLIASRASRERDLVVAMVAARILEPDSKLATTRAWHSTTLAELMGVADADEEELYAALDWLVEGQKRIEKKLAARHLQEGSLVLFDLSSSYFEGKKCPLAAYGYNRDGKRGKLQVNWGLLCDVRGCPVAVTVFSGNTSDPDTLLPQVKKTKTEFGITELVLVGDRGMISQKQIDQLKDQSGVQWISALRSGAIQKLLQEEVIQPGLFDEQNLFSITHADYPGERLVVCRNLEMAKLRAHKRQALLEATITELDKVKAMVAGGRLKAADAIGVRVGKVINKRKVAKHFELTIGENSFEYRLNQKRIEQEAASDGIYVIRTSLSQERMSSEDTVRRYKDLSHVEQAFRSIKTIDLEVRPIYHRLEARVKAHFLLCMLAYYLKWHMMQAWKPLLFSGEQQNKETRNPTAGAKRSKSALAKIQSKTLPDGTPVHSFHTLLRELSTIVRNRCRPQGTQDEAAAFELDTTPSPQQRRAFELLATIRV